jgi:hypothetical protein
MNYRLSNATIECLTRSIELSKQALDRYTSKGSHFAYDAEMSAREIYEMQQVVVTESTKSLAGSALAVERLEQGLHALTANQRRQILDDIQKAKASQDDGFLTPSQIKYLDTL